LVSRQQSRGSIKFETRAAAQGVVARLVPSLVTVDVEKTSWNSRKLFAQVPINAPVNVVWGCLTDYEGLSSFIPSLVENRCLQKRARGALLYQVGAQDVAMGMKFSAACTLDCTEFTDGVPETFCSTSGDGSDGLLPYPRGRRDLPARDITFVMIDGDFHAFRGIWRMQPGTEGADRSTLLCYSLYVQPQPWLPVSIIQNRIEKEVARNLAAVRKHAEQLHSTKRA